MRHYLQPANSSLGLLLLIRLFVGSIVHQQLPAALENEKSIDHRLHALNSNDSHPHSTRGTVREFGQAPEWPQLNHIQIVSGVAHPTDLRQAADGSRRMFITEQLGKIKILREGQVLADPFLDITDRVKRLVFDDGLSSVAFPQDFPSTGRFYVTYTRDDGEGEWEAVLSRFLVGSDPDIADPSSEEVLMVVDQDAGFHNLWQLQFRHEGYLYIASGDGGPSNDTLNYAQNPASFRGKILRIDTERELPMGAAYAIPISNPFLGDAGVLDEIWALGLRSPWRIAFDRYSGDLYIADVGQNEWEEINFQSAQSPGGENYGWRVYEGNQSFSDTFGLGPGELTPPVAEYSHLDRGCAIIGGYVYRGQLYPRMRGIYFYGDFCTGQIWGLRRIEGDWVSQELIDTSFPLTTFGEDEAGNLYFADRDGGIYHLADDDAHTRLPICEVGREKDGAFEFTFETVPGRSMRIQ